MHTAAGLSLPIILTDCLVASDGGSMRFEFTDAGRKDHFLEIPQNVLKENFVPGVPPGVLILDGRALAAGQDEEKEILSALKSAGILPLPEKSEITSMTRQSVSRRRKKCARRRGRLSPEWWTT